MKKMMLLKILPELAFQKILNIVNRCIFRLKFKETLITEGNAQGRVVYDELMSFCKQLITSCELPLDEFISGSIKKEEASFLYNLIIQEKPKNVLQVGTFLGFSTLIIAEALIAILSDISMEKMFDVSILKSHDGLAIFRKVKEYVSVRICIKDKLTQKPLPGTVLYSKSHGEKAVSDLKGEIYIPTILADNYCIDIIANGYKSLHNYCVSLDPHRSFQALTIEVEQER